MNSFEEVGQASVGLTEVIARVCRGDESTIARMITLLEQRGPGRIPILKALFPFTGHAQIIGITGAPGSGKSTLAGQLIREYRNQSKTVGVIAIDPTSPYSGGATLGDRVRMQGNHCDSGVFIRSMASRGQLGGLAPAAADVATLLDASGRDRILIETVGVGQDQLDILSIADVLVVLTVPGMGDEIQAAKAGIVEAADILVVNKSDYAGADQAERVLRDSVSLAHRKSGWVPPVIRTTATAGDGITNLVLAMDDYFEQMHDSGLEHTRTTDKWKRRLLQMIREHLMEHLLSADYGPLFQAYAEAIACRHADPYTVVEQLVGGTLERSDLHACRTSGPHGVDSTSDSDRVGATER